MSGLPRIWLLLGHRRGDNNQLLALGEALGLPFETRTLAYRRSARLIMRLLPSSIAHLTAASRATLGPPWPDLVIGIGRRSVPVARWIKAMSGDKAGIVRLGHPRAPSNWFDLVLTTPQYPVPEAPGVVTLPLALNRFRDPPAPTHDEQTLLDSLPRPHVLLSLGGTAPMWRLDLEQLDGALAKMLRSTKREGGTLLVAPSPRTPVDAINRVSEAIANAPNARFLGPDVRYPVAVADADEHVVTADSVSMISEAIVTGKPVGLIPVRRDLRGRLRLGGDPEGNALRDPRRFWRHVEALGLAGTVDAPRKGHVPDPLAIAVAEVRRRFALLFD